MLIRYLTSAVFALAAFSGSAMAVPIYLEQSLIDVSVGDRTSEGSFNNTFSGGATIDKTIDAPSADATEFHTQATHIWFSTGVPGGGLELDFDLNDNYDITTLHFWNYTGETYDVDNIDFDFFNETMERVGGLSIMPDLGSSPGIRAQDIPLAAPLNVRFVSAFLTGSNGQVDFQNIGFSAELSDPTTPPAPGPAPVPLPGGLPLLGVALLGLAALRRRSGG